MSDGSRRGSVNGIEPFIWGFSEGTHNALVVLVGAMCVLYVFRVWGRIRPLRLLHHALETSNVVWLERLRQARPDRNALLQILRLRAAHVIVSVPKVHVTAHVDPSSVQLRLEPSSSVVNDQPHVMLRCRVTSTVAARLCAYVGVQAVALDALGADDAPTDPPDKREKRDTRRRRSSADHTAALLVEQSQRLLAPGRQDLFPPQMVLHTATMADVPVGEKREVCVPLPVAALTRAVCSTQSPDLRNALCPLVLWLVPLDKELQEADGSASSASTAAGSEASLRVSELTLVQLPPGRINYRTQLTVTGSASLPHMPASPSLATGPSDGAAERVVVRPPIAYPVTAFVPPTSPDECLALLSVALAKMTADRQLVAHAEASAASPTPTVFVSEAQELFGLEDDSPECVVCISETRDIILLPCRHVCVCAQCHANLTKCPVCRADIASFLRFVDPNLRDFSLRHRRVTGTTATATAAAAGGMAAGTTAAGAAPSDAGLGSGPAGPGVHFSQVTARPAGTGGSLSSHSSLSLSHDRVAGEGEGEGPTEGGGGPRVLGAASPLASRLGESNELKAPPSVRAASIASRSLSDPRGEISPDGVEMTTFGVTGAVPATEDVSMIIRPVRIDGENPLDLNSQLDGMVGVGELPDAAGSASSSASPSPQRSRAATMQGWESKQSS